jgi:uncharacterized protein (DUF1697 family)
MTTYAAFLRAINLGATNPMSMPKLRAALEETRFTGARTYLQSGNVVFEHRSGAAAVTRAVEKAIADTFALDITVIVRTAAEMLSAVQANPFLRPGADEKRLHVLFLADTPARGAFSRIDRERSPGDELRLRGRDLYLFLPNGVSGSKLGVSYIEKCLGTAGTMRNWNTANRVAALAND